VIEQNGILDAKGFEDLIRNAPYESEEKRQKMLEVVNYVNSYRPEEEE
jgi:protein subunit release factor B